jgi:hypothetical protein
MNSFLVDLHGILAPMLGVTDELPEPFVDGSCFQWRHFSEGKYQVYAKGLYHIAECNSPQMAELVCKALNKATK